MSWAAGDLAERLRAAAREGRLAHAYAVAGPVEEVMRDVVTPWLGEVLRGALEGHPDVHRVRPSSKLRQIPIEAMRGLIGEMSQTAFLGGWKAGIVEHADRLTVPAANAFLKTLEEPAPRTLLVLVTEFPERLLPTVRSRCLMARVRAGARAELPAALAPVAEALAGGKPGDWLKAYQALNVLTDHLAGRKAAGAAWVKEKMGEAKEAGAEGGGLEDIETALNAEAEAAYQGERRRILADLLERVFRADTRRGERSARLFEDAAHAMQRNVPEALALERLFVRFFAEDRRGNQ